MTDMAWDDLDRELDIWATTGRLATLWWRDDDAGADHPALRRLCELGPAPLTLAVIPADATALDLPAHVSVVQHGHAHANHAGADGKKSEFPPGREPSLALTDLAGGRKRLAELFGPRLRPVLVPPWNRIAPALLPRLPRLGFHGLSTFSPRRAVHAAPALMQVNTHVDVIDWHGTRGFVGDGPALGQLVGHLAARRAGVADAAEPTGLLTHHLQHDEATWGFIGQLFQRTLKHPAARWLDVASAFGAGA
jgi:hypothetical protein